MTKINQVAKGESDWQVTLNQLINVVNELGGVRSNTLLTL